MEEGVLPIEMGAIEDSCSTDEVISELLLLVVLVRIILILDVKLVRFARMLTHLLIVLPLELSRQICKNVWSSDLDQ